MTVSVQRQHHARVPKPFGDDLGLYTTVQTAKDMDAIRATVGDDKLTYLGFSYGTLLGAVASLRRVLQVDPLEATNVGAAG